MALNNDTFVHVLEYLADENPFAFAAPYGLLILKTVSKSFADSTRSVGLYCQNAINHWVKERNILMGEDRQFTLHEISPLVNAVQQTSINLRIINLSNVEGLTTQMLKELFKKNPQIEHLKLEYTTVEELPEECSQVKTFMCERAENLRELPPLMSFLTYLNCKFCPSLTSLPLMPRLQKLDCTSCSSLKSLPSLQMVISGDCSMCGNLSPEDVALAESHNMSAYYCTALSLWDS